MWRLSTSVCLWYWSSKGYFERVARRGFRTSRVRRNVIVWFLLRWTINFRSLFGWGFGRRSFLLTIFFFLLPVEVGLFRSEVCFSSEAGADCVGTNTIEFSKLFCESDGRTANICCSNLWVGPKVDWFGSIYVLIALKERNTSFGSMLMGIGSLHSMYSCWSVRAQNLGLEVSFGFPLMANFRNSYHRT